MGEANNRYANLQVENGFASMSQRISKLSQDFMGEFRLTQSREAIVEIDNRISRTILTSWVVDIVLLLSVRGPSRFEDIRKSLPGIAGKVLSRKLTFLEEKGFVRRMVSTSKPPGVRYQLSRKGTTFAELGKPLMMFLRYLESRH